jgi:hypothetical protein
MFVKENKKGHTHISISFFYCLIHPISNEMSLVPVFSPDSSLY